MFSLLNTPYSQQTDVKIGLQMKLATNYTGPLIVISMNQYAQAISLVKMYKISPHTHHLYKNASQNGFQINSIIEPEPAPELKDLPEMQDEYCRPMMLIISATKN